MGSGIVEGAIRRNIHAGQVIRLRASGKPFEVDRIESTGIVLLFGAKRTPTRLRWEWLEGTVPFLRERGSAPIGGTYTVEAEADTLDAYLKHFINRATANWVAALLEESGVVVVEQGTRLTVRLAEGSDLPPGVSEDFDGDIHVPADSARAPRTEPAPASLGDAEDSMASKGQHDDYGRDNEFSTKSVPAPKIEPGVTSQGDVENLMEAESGPVSFSDGAHRDALLKRRIKFVVEKGAMARLFKRGTHAQLQAELSRRLRPSAIAALNSRGEFDQWLYTLIQSDCWEPYSRNGLAEDRWAYFAKLINILVYEIVVNRELFCEPDWRRVQRWLHLPLDSTVFGRLRELDPSFPVSVTLRGMTRENYHKAQEVARSLAEHYQIPTIWFDDAWSS